MEQLDGLTGVFTERGNLYTLSLSPGKRVYGERLVRTDNKEFREWSPRRSKLSAYLTKGGRCFPFEETSNVLYLGASGGTTASHVSDVCHKGSVMCVEFSSRMFRDLVSVCENRSNMMPILGDATRPEEYRFVSDDIHVVYQDVAQKNQAAIAADNAEAVGAEYGMVAIKSRSEDVTAAPGQVFKASEKVLTDRGFRILDVLSLDPYEKDHAMLVFEV